MKKPLQSSKLKAYQSIRVRRARVKAKENGIEVARIVKMS